MWLTTDKPACYGGHFFARADISGSTYPNPTVATVGGITAAVIGGIPAKLPIECSVKLTPAIGAGPTPVNPSITNPRGFIAVGVNMSSGGGAAMSIGFSDGISTIAGQIGLAAGGSASSSGVILDSGGGGTRYTLAFGASMTLTRSAGADSPDLLSLTIGDKA